MIEWLLDTNVLIEWFVGTPASRKLLELIREERPRLSTSVICAAEFLVKAGEKERDTLQDLVASGEVLLRGLDGWEMASRVARVRAQADLPMPDALILATAVEARGTLVTRDERFARQTSRIPEANVRLL